MRNLNTTYRPGPSQNRTFTATSANAAAIDGHNFNVRLVADQGCYVCFDGRAAVTTDMELVAGVPEYFSIQGGAVISVIRKTADGTLNITEMTQ